MSAIGLTDADERRSRAWAVADGWMLLAMVVVFYLVLGCFMETLSMMITTIPIVAPIMTALAYDPIWLGIVIIVLVEAALITPPVGLNLFVVQSLRKSGSIRGDRRFAALRAGTVRGDRAAGAGPRPGTVAAPHLRLTAFFSPPTSMQLTFSITAAAGTSTLAVAIDHFVIAGWAGRDAAAIEHHIEELAEIGVPRPSAVPLFYRVAANQLTQDDTVQVVGPDSSGEVEVLLFSHAGRSYVSLTSDHTDRKLEAHSVALSKQLCAKPVAREAWPLEEVLGHWDSLRIVASIIEDGREVTYQDGTLDTLRDVRDLALRHCGHEQLPDGMAMSCGTVAVRGGIRPANVFSMALVDERLGRRLSHRYTLDCLPVVA
jgi:hypothetical protein